MNNLNCFANSLNFGLLPKGLLTLFITILCGVPLPCTAADDLTIYNDAIANGWEDWSWDGVTSSPNTAIKKVGISSLAVKYSSAWQGLSYHHIGTAVNSKNYTAIHFWVYGSSGSGLLQVVIQDKTTSPESTPFYFTPTANKWAQITVPLSKLGNPATIARLSIKDATGTTQPVFYIDDLRLIAKLAMTIDAAANRKPISEQIYGINFYGMDETGEDDGDFMKKVGVTVRRWGGNTTSRYNWKIDATNSGHDWYFENGTSSDIHTPNKAVSRMVGKNSTNKVSTLLTVPMIGFVAKDGKNSSCGFRISKYGPQQEYDNHTGGQPDCGKGIKLDGKPVTDNSHQDTSIPFNPNSIKEWINYLKKQGLGKSGVQFYNLDNEVDGWHITHRDVFPTAIKYDQLRDHTYQYAAAIKSVDPTAKILGPVLTDWSHYWNSAYDLQKNDSKPTNDRNTHGGTPLVAWYLQQMKAYDKKYHKRILDYLDLHFYPHCFYNVNDKCTLTPELPHTQDNPGNAALQALRLRSTRSLWDPTYVGESWVKNVEGGVIKLIPRMKEWVDKNYPGTKLAISEYMWGALGHINGALAQADVLGIFGREGLDLATLWQLRLTSDQPGAFAFRIYRNYNANGGKFGNTSVLASSTDQGKVAIYAAQEGTNGALTLMVINKTATAQSAPITLKNFKPTGVIETWRYGAANLNSIVHPVNLKFTGLQFANSFPANSITLLRIPSKH
ncbi:hypothetical protein CRENPOLYSF2_1870003 [Crenothrix polyspora]|uniref:Glycoside hydrolase family 44 catalytic domain-containing protein n=1 Tax=Crenothrix polyspora TaxID=360316 RepID=A0A1R4H3R1_9GAMM|nr:glycoside hydrolase family 44 protein [Crenothrix polyspora]SJM90816.1 hypothetical protein CRENPOLYSF2_1870003 [Crenothrix polyspora]